MKRLLVVVVALLAVVALAALPGCVTTTNPDTREVTQRIDVEALSQLYTVYVQEQQRLKEQGALADAAKEEARQARLEELQKLILGTVVQLQQAGVTLPKVTPE